MLKQACVVIWVLWDIVAQDMLILNHGYLINRIALERATIEGDSPVNEN